MDELSSEKSESLVVFSLLRLLLSLKSLAILMRIEVSMPFFCCERNFKLGGICDTFISRRVEKDNNDRCNYLQQSKKLVVSFDFEDEFVSR